ncbi:tetratricopeptide repeat protein [Candidatus Woesearchaeota archaeon]|nr:tetratricopeptide repeat protein [Candidatus Woesearchaeota archaeon]
MQNLTVEELEKEFDDLETLEIKVKKSRRRIPKQMWLLSALTVFTVYEGVCGLTDFREYSLVCQTKARVMNSVQNNLDDSVEEYLARDYNYKKLRNDYNSLLREVNTLKSTLEAYKRNNKPKVPEDYADIWINISFLYSEMKKYDEAIDACDRAIILKPNNKSYRLRKGDILNQMYHGKKKKFILF